MKLNMGKCKVLPLAAVQAGSCQAGEPLCSPGEPGDPGDLGGQ